MAASISMMLMDVMFSENEFCDSSENSIESDLLELMSDRGIFD